jgi:hypothetical protein
MVRLACVSEAWKTRDSKGSRGWVQYRSINAKAPQRNAAKTLE